MAATVRFLYCFIFLLYFVAGPGRWAIGATTK